MIANNRAYRILKERILLLNGKAKEFGQFIGMDFQDPELDFLKLAGSIGAPAVRAETPAELQAHLQEGIAAGKPCLIDAIVRNKPL